MSTLYASVPYSIHFNEGGMRTPLWSTYTFQRPSLKFYSSFSPSYLFGDVSPVEIQNLFYIRLHTVVMIGCLKYNDRITITSVILTKGSFIAHPLWRNLLRVTE
jgi:hypothetical protein